MILNTFIYKQFTVKLITKNWQKTVYYYYYNYGNTFVLSANIRQLNKLI